MEDGGKDVPAYPETKQQRDLAHRFKRSIQQKMAKAMRYIVKKFSNLSSRQNILD